MLPGPSPMVPVYPGCGPQIYGAPQAPEIVATNPLPVNSRDIGDGQPIGANGTQKALPTSPTVTMCIKQYIVARTSGPFFDVMSIKAARVEYNGDGGGVPAECYSPDSTMRMPQQFPWLNPGTQIIVLVRNNDGQAQHFGSTFIGVSYASCAPCS